MEIDSYNDISNVKKEKFHCFYFFQNDDGPGVKVEGHHYNLEESGNFVPGSPMGELYHIVLVKDHPEDKEKFANLDCFEAILVEPVTYIIEMIKQGWYGIIARKTEHSHETVDLAVDKLRTLL